MEDNIRQDKNRVKQKQDGEWVRRKRTRQLRWSGTTGGGLVV